MGIRVKGYDVSGICREAAEVVRRDGLKKGGFGSKDGPKCAMGAVRYVVGGDPQEFLDDHLWGAVARTLFRRVRPRSKRGGLVDFSDAARTRRHDVVEVLLDIADYAATHRALP